MPNEPWPPGEPSGIVNRGKRIAAGFALLGFMKAAEKHAESQEEPVFQTGNPVVVKLADLARSLAKNEPDDDTCVRTLLSAAGSKPHNLSRAAASVRFNGQASMSRNANRANRLLLAAHSGSPVEPLPRDLDELFTRVEALYAVRVEDAFPTLVDLQPDLRKLEQQFSRRNIGEEVKNAVWDELLGALAPVIGPEANPDVTDPLLRLDSAHNIARLFLAVRVGLLDEVDYD